MNVAIIGGGLASPKTSTRSLRITVIGGGFTGLTAAYDLSKRGHHVTLFEKEPHLGGLAYGFTNPNWQWHLEAAYHHLFTNDRHIIGLIHELGLSDTLIIKRPITANLLPPSLLSSRPSSRPGLYPDSIGVDSGSGVPIFQLDSPMHLFRFPALSIQDKFRTAILLAFLKLFPFWKLLEGFTAEQLLVSIGGVEAWKTIWEPLLYGKFGDFAPTVSAAWFWARIQKRTQRLCYIEGGFHTLVEALRKAIIDNGGEIFTSTAVESIQNVSGGSYNVLWKKHKQKFDKVLITIPTPFALSLLPKYEIRNTKYESLLSIPHLTAQTLILETDKPILKDVYWLNVTDRSFPFLAAVAHTNFMDSKYYGNHHLTYFGNYLPHGHPYLSMTKEQLLKKIMPFIKRLLPSPNYQLRITNSHMFVGPFAQPVHQLHYSQKIPPIQTPIPGIYMANMDYVVPWDRGTNYAVELGQRAAKCILKEAK